ncbi:heme-binding beta-barrel domain-containing protein, partial [bacterium]|nr:heme-binding beta-barrel domain-containing protein [bacterium]
GPLARLAGTWTGKPGVDVHPSENGPEEQPYTEYYDLQPLDPQTNGPQLYYGLRYHTRITSPGEEFTFHEQVGYWLWEPATQTVLLTISIPRGQTALACGKSAPDASGFVLTSKRGSTFNGILSNPFLEKNFTTTDFEMTVRFEKDGTWSYEQTTTLQVKGEGTPFLHTDRNRLRKTAEPKANPFFLGK